MRSTARTYVAVAIFIVVGAASAIYGITRNYDSAVLLGVIIGGIVAALEWLLTRKSGWPQNVWGVRAAQTASIASYPAAKLATTNKVHLVSPVAVFAGCVCLLIVLYVLALAIWDARTKHMVVRRPDIEL